MAEIQAQSQASQAQKPVEQTTEQPEVVQTKTETTETNTQPKLEPTDDTDILTKVLAPKPDKEDNTDNTQDNVSKSFTEADVKFDANEINEIVSGIQDPKAQEYLRKMAKSLEKGGHEKFQAIAQMRREVELQKTELEQKMSQKEAWTPERVQSLLNNQEFINASQQIISANPAQTQTDEYESEELQAIKQLTSEINRIKQESLTKEQAANIAREDEIYSQKYGNYNPKEMAIIRQELMQGKRKVTSEEVYKAFYHDDNVKRAYQQGLAEGRSGISAKASSSTTDDAGTVAQTDTVVRKEGESSGDFFMRIVKSKMRK